MADQRTGELETERRAPPHEEVVDAYTIRVIDGPDAGATFTLRAASPGRLLIGTSPACTLRVTDRGVSRRHLAMRADGKTLVLSDLGSTNGTFVNGVAIREALLHGGEVLKIGSTSLSVSSSVPENVAIVQDSAFGRMQGESLPMRALYPVLHEVASRDFPILIEGEPGVGKHLCAQELHAYSPRADQPFASLACRAIPESELEGRIFDAGGLVEQAEGGTIYLDEVGALPDAVQARLLQAIIKGTGPRSNSPSGGRPPQAADLRFILGTRLDLDQEVSEGRFRDDLFAVLAPRRIEMPPLRERRTDIALLARSFWTALVAESPDDDVAPVLPPDVLPRFHNYRWPGNVRELARAICTRFCLGEFGRWRSEEVRRAGEDAFASVLDRELPLAEAREAIVSEFERRYVAYMFDRHGSTREAAAASGVAQRYFQVLRARFRES